MLYTPLMSAGQPIGLISVTRKEPGAFAAHHVQLLQTFADQAVIAIENVRLFNETQEALERQTATADILKVIASSPSDVQPVFDAIAAQRQTADRRVFHCRVHRVIDDIDHLVAFTPTNSGRRRSAQGSVPTASKRDAGDHQSGRERRDGADRRLRSSRRANPETCPCARLAQRALHAADEPGHLHRFHRLHAARDGHASPIITSSCCEPFADQAVIAIENARLFNEVQAKTHDLTESLHHQTGAEVLKVISRLGDRRRAGARRLRSNARKAVRSV